QPVDDVFGDTGGVQLLGGQGLGVEGAEGVVAAGRLGAAVEKDPSDHRFGVVEIGQQLGEVPVRAGVGEGRAGIGDAGSCVGEGCVVAALACGRVLVAASARLGGGKAGGGGDGAA